MCLSIVACVTVIVGMGDDVHMSDDDDDDDDDEDDEDDDDGDEDEWFVIISTKSAMELAQGGTSSPKSSLVEKIGLLGMELQPKQKCG